MLDLDNIKVIIKDTYEDMSKYCAKIFAEQLRKKPETVIGLATGSTPVAMYGELINLYKSGNIDFSKATAFNLDEYFPLKRSDPQSYHYFMENTFFKYINMKQERINIPNGEATSPEEECKNYEKKITDAGGIDIQLLGIGTNGHIGFNEPAKVFSNSTTLTDLNKSTIESNSRFFKSMDDVPRKAISMGIKTIMMSKKIILIANGINKSEIISKSLTGDITPEVPASVLQLHKDVTVVLDKDAAKSIVSILKK